MPGGKVLMGRVRPGGEHGRRTLGRTVQAVPPKDGRRLSPCRRGRQGRGATALRRCGRPAEAAESPGSLEGAHRMGSKDSGGCGGDGGDGGQQGRTGFPPLLRQGGRSEGKGLARGAQVFREIQQEGGQRESQRRQAKALGAAPVFHTGGSRSTASATLRIQSLLQVIFSDRRSAITDASQSISARIIACRYSSSSRNRRGSPFERAAFTAARDAASFSPSAVALADSCRATSSGVSTIMKDTAAGKTGNSRTGVERIDRSQA